MKLMLMNTNAFAQIDPNICREYFPIRYSKAIQFSDSLAKKHSIIAGYIVHYLMKIPEDKIDTNEFGKPLSLVQTKFNVSHSKKYVVAAFDQNEVGVDIEFKDRKISDLLKKSCFNEEESGNDYVLMWTIKESIIKLLGTGLNFDVSSINSSEIISNGFLVINDKTVFCKSIEFDGYYISLASFNKIDEIEICETKVN